MAITGTYVFPQFNVQIINPSLTVISKRYVYASDLTEVEIKLTTSTAEFGVIISATNAQGGSQNIQAITQWVENYLDNNHKI